MAEASARVLDQMVTHILAYEEVPFFDLVQQAWRQGWDIASVPDPRDADPLRYALKASVLERMAELWSAPPRNRPVEPPSWCASVPAVATHFSVIRPDFADFWQGEAGAPAFEKRNIFAPLQYMFFV